MKSFRYYLPIIFQAQFLLNGVIIEICTHMIYDGDMYSQVPT